MKRTASIYQTELPANPNKSVDHATTLVHVDTLWLSSVTSLWLSSVTSALLCCSNNTYRFRAARMFRNTAKSSGSYLDRHWRSFGTIVAGNSSSFAISVANLSASFLKEFSSSSAFRRYFLSFSAGGTNKAPCGVSGQMDRIASNQSTSS